MARSAPDGYTLLMASGSLVAINPHIYASMPFDPAKDIVPVASVARVPFYLVVRAENPAQDFKAFIADLKSNPGKRNFGSPGIGSSPHLAAELLKKMTGTDAVHVPYRGAAPALNDLLAGQLDFVFDPGIAIEHVKAGKLRAIAPRRQPTARAAASRTYRPWTNSALPALMPTPFLASTRPPQRHATLSRV